MHSIFKLLMTLSLQGRQELRLVFLFTAMHAFFGRCTLTSVNRWRLCHLALKFMTFIIYINTLDSTTHFNIDCCCNWGYGEARLPFYFLLFPFCLAFTDRCVAPVQTPSKYMIALLVFQLNCRVEAVYVHLGWAEKKGENLSSDNGPVWKLLARRMFIGKLSTASSQSGSLSGSAAKQNIELLSVPWFFFRSHGTCWIILALSKWNKEGQRAMFHWPTSQNMEPNMS